MPTVVKPFKPYSRRGVALLHLGVPVCIVMFAIGLAGLIVLLDTEQKSFLAHTDFARYYRWLISKNPFFSAFFVNGGGIGLIIIAVQLSQQREFDRDQKQDEAVTQLPPPVAVAPRTNSRSKKAL